MNAADIARVASHPGAPLAEQRDARAELQKEFAPTRSQLPAVRDMKNLVDQMLHAYEMGEMEMVKGVQTPSLWSGTGLYPNHHGRGLQMPKSVIVDERGMLGAVPGGYKRRPSNFQSEHLRLMVEQVPLINAIILRRQRTIGRFLRPSERNRDLYFEVRKNDPSGTIEERKGEAETDLESFLMHSGEETVSWKMRRLKRDRLRGFVDKGIRDLLTLDAWAIELVPTLNGKSIVGYHSVDAGSVYLASEEGYQGDDEIVAVQLVSGIPVTTYSWEELSFNVMNPRSDVWNGGYGYPPPEMIVKVLTGYLNAINYNLKGFDANAIPKGMLTLVGEYDERELKFFKQQWNAMVKGINNAWAMPVMVSDTKDAQAHFEKFGVDFSDMYFSKWMVLLTAIVCSVYGMDPAEVYSESFSAGKSSLSGQDTEARLTEARDTGLEPVMTFIEDVITHEIIDRRNADGYILRFHGIQPSDKAWEHEVDKMTLSVNELRKKEGRPQTEESWGNAPLNPSLQGAYNTQMQQEAAAAQADAQAGGEPGKPGEDSAVKPEAILEEKGDQKGAVQKPAEPIVEETGDRDLDQDDPKKVQNIQEISEQQWGKSKAKHRPVNPDEPSTMMRKAGMGEILVVG